jgi:hypothetical protein
MEVRERKKVFCGDFARRIGAITASNWPAKYTPSGRTEHLDASSRFNNAEAAGGGKISGSFDSGEISASDIPPPPSLVSL